jgi:transposase-like protein
MSRRGWCSCLGRIRRSSARELCSLPERVSVRSLIARELGIAESCLRNWLKRDQLDRRERDDGVTSAEREELRRLRRENARLKQEKETLREAAAFFAREEIR